MAKKELKIGAIEDYAKMNDKELRKAARGVLKAARQRAERMMKSEKMKDRYSPALEGAKATKAVGQVALFESRGKTRNQLLREIKRAKTFVEGRTSSVSGTIAYEKDVSQKLQEALGREITIDTVRKLWPAYERIKQNNRWVADRQFKYQVVDQVASMVEQGMSQTEIINSFGSIMDNLEGLDYGDNSEGWVDIPF